MTLKSSRQWIVTGLFIAFSLPLVAGQATIEAVSDDDGQGGTIQLEYRGHSQVRMNLPEQPGGYLLVKDAVAYSVSTEDGQAVVMRLDALRGLGQLMPSPSPTDDVAKVIQLSQTGGEETVAGIRGQVWSLRYQDSDGQSRQEEMVLSDDARVLELTRAMTGLSTAMMAALGQEPPQGLDSLQARLEGKGILRMGQSMRVIALDGGLPPISRFSLPAAPTAMPGIEGLGNKLGELFGQKAEAQQERVGDRVEQEADNSIDKKVRGFLDSLF